MRAHCRCFGGPEQARLFTVTCLYFGVCFVLRHLRSRITESCPTETAPPARLCLRVYIPIPEVVATHRLNRVAELGIRLLCLEDIHPNTSQKFVRGAIDHSTDQVAKGQCCCSAEIDHCSDRLDCGGAHAFDQIVSVRGDLVTSQGCATALLVGGDRLSRCPIIY